MKQSEMLSRARSAYERGRWWKGVRASAFVVPLMLVSFGCCGRLVISTVIAVALAALVAGFVWRGGAAAKAVVPGYVAGIAPLAIPLVACPACATMHSAIAMCVAGGLASGAIVAFYGARERGDRGAFIVCAGAVAALSGSLGCLIMGLGGIVAMVCGIALITPFGLRTARA